ncbi:SDR family NAD(P)-dependent oxidoreductase [Micromonospora sp. CPCC 206061]|uniref:SDR family NAD(P)-dependent oxidoreductase n=1 Tax=Micromonospora sp. CPCC 206061 TaxID=3122410 RepID=UPI002FF192E4
MDALLNGKNALVTGGARGIGRAITLGLARAGATVVACYRTPGEAVDTLATELKEIGGEHHLIRADVADPVEVDQLVHECRERVGTLHTVVNNAGVISHVSFAELPLEEWHRVLDTNLTGAFLVTQKCLPLLGPGASIVHIGSRGARAGVPLRSHYTAAKAGLVGLTRSLAKELGPRGIRVNVVAPGVIDTDVERRMPAEQRAQIEARYRQLTALGRLGTPDEVAGAVVFLASDLSAYLTGETLDVDGGI